MRFPLSTLRSLSLFSSAFAFVAISTEVASAHSPSARGGGGLAAPGSHAAGLQRKLGTAASMLDGVLKSKTSATAVYTFVASTGDPIVVDVRDYYFEHGQLSMTGTARGSRNSSFILKGNAEQLYGWVVLKDRNLAFEYTTDASGAVVVETVPVTKIYPICAVQHAGSAPNAPVTWAAGPHRAGPEPHIGQYDGTTNVNTLQSLPGAELVMYLDISDIMNGETPITLSSKAEVWMTWQSVASSLSMYEVNVTTDQGVYAAAGVANSGKACFYNQDGRSNSGLDIWGTTQCSNNYKNTGQGYGLGRTAAHEIGHTLGMSHDGGQPGGEYFEGLPEFEWCPIMGNYWFGNAWNQALYQWSKGEYTGSSQKQDDLARILRWMPYRADDIPMSVPLMLTGTDVSALNNRGQITPNTDSDTFTFEIGPSGGSAKLKVDRTEYIGGAMLDVAAEIQNSGGTKLAEGNASKARYADLDVDLPQGQYKLVVKSGAEGTPANGFSNYSSLGFYAIEGTIEGASGTGGAGGMGGTGGVGGSSGMGGTAGTGGTAGVGGTAGMGGSGGTGGDAGMGGSAGTSGTGGDAGMGGSAGTSGTGGDAGMGGMGGSAGMGGTGGDAGMGGTAGTSGAGGAGMGGLGGVGGVAGVGGTSGAGGIGGTGAAAGTGGSSGTGGSGGTGGSSGTGGAGGVGGTSGSAGTGGTGASGDTPPDEEVTCTCKVVGQSPAEAPTHGLLLAALFGAIAWARRRR